MKTVMSLYLHVDVVKALKAQSQNLNVPASTLAEQALRGALGLTATGSTGPETPRQTSRRYTRRESACLAALDALMAQYAALPPEDPALGNRFFPLGELAHAAGLYPSEALQGLRGLERAKVVSCVMTQDIRFLRLNPETPEVEHWGRAVVTAG